MSLIVEELDIVNVEVLFVKKLVLPLYQRPYSWSKESVNTLFNDTYSAFQSDINEYRLGSVILHREEQKNSKNKKYIYYNIVDGQQRLTTLSILLHCLKYKKNTLMDKEFSRLSTDAIVTNYLLLSRRVKDLPDNDREAYKKYLLEKCTIVQVVTEREQEAFQFFDSQNSRGKALAPHDLLKSYHLIKSDEPRR